MPQLHPPNGIGSVPIFLLSIRNIALGIGACNLNKCNLTRGSVDQKG